MDIITQKESNIIYSCVEAIKKAFENKVCTLKEFTVADLEEILRKLRIEE